MNVLTKTPFRSNILGQVECEGGLSQTDLLRLRNEIAPLLRERPAFDESCPEIPFIRKIAGTWQSVTELYEHENKYGEGTPEQILMSIPSIQALRNRFRVLQDYLLRAAAHFETHGIPMRLVELAAGSAPALLEVIVHLKQTGYTDINVLLVDKDVAGLERAKEYAKKHGISDMVTVRQADLKRRHGWNIVREFQPTAIEMVGLGDYFKAKIVEIWAKRIYDILPQHGVYITSNVAPNQIEPAGFIHWENFFKWKDMYYRGAAEFERLLNAGFVGGRLSVETEPVGLHVLAVGVK